MHVEPPCEKALLRLIEPGVPVAGGIACRALASVLFVAARRVCGHAPEHRKVRTCAALAARIRCPCLMSAREAATPINALRDVFSNFSQTLEIEKRPDRPGEILTGALRRIIETVETR